MTAAAITTVVTIAEILKNNGLATEKSKILALLNTVFCCLELDLDRPADVISYVHVIETEVLISSIGMKDENKGRMIQKAKVRSLLSRSC